jgi:integrase
MPRKPKEGCHEIHVSHAGAAVRVTLFPPRAAKKERTWFAYWKGQKTRRSTGKKTLREAIEAATAMVQEQPTGHPGDWQCPSDEEFIEIQRRHFGKKPDRSGKGASLTGVLQAVDAFKRVSGLTPICRATPDDCERFQTEALKLLRNWRSQHPKSKPETRTITPATVKKWLLTLHGAFERVNDNAGRKCVRGVVPPERLLKSNPWQRFTWIEPPKKKIEQFQSDDLLKLLLHFRTAWPGVTAAEAMLKVYVWSWARREEVAGLKWSDLRAVEEECHFDTVGKRGKEWWFRIPKSVHEELLRFKTESPYVFAKLVDQIREFHLTEGRESAAKMVKEFTVYNAGRWFYDQVKKWDSDAYVHMFRKTSLQYARAGQDATRSLARDARVTEAVMMTHYVKEEDLQLRAASNAMYQRLCLSMTPEVARAFGHEHSATAILEQRLRDAIGARNWPLVGEVAKKLAKQDRQAG